MKIKKLASHKIRDQYFLNFKNENSGLILFFKIILNIETRLNKYLTPKTKRP